MESAAIIPSFHVQKTGGSTFEYEIAGFCCNISRESEQHNNCKKIIFHEKNMTCTTGNYLRGHNCGYHPNIRQLYDCTSNYVGKRKNQFPEYNGIQYYVTVLRDPVHRVVSEYFQVLERSKTKQTISFWDHSSSFMTNFSSTNMSIEDFVKHPVSKANNRQSLALMGAVWNHSSPYSFRENLIFWEKWVESTNILANTIKDILFITAREKDLRRWLCNFLLLLWGLIIVYRDLLHCFYLFLALFITWVFHIRDVTLALFTLKNTSNWSYFTITPALSNAAQMSKRVVERCKLLIPFIILEEKSQRGRVIFIFFILFFQRENVSRSRGWSRCDECGGIKRVRTLFWDRSWSVSSQTWVECPSIMIPARALCLPNIFLFLSKSGR